MESRAKWNYKPAGDHLGTGFSGSFGIPKEPLNPVPKWSTHSIHNVAISTFKCPLVRCLPEIIFAMLSTDTTKLYGREMKHFLKKKECRMYMKIRRKLKMNNKKCRISLNFLHVNICRIVIQ